MNILLFSIFTCTLQMYFHQQQFQYMKMEEQIQKGHILKFVHHGKTFNPNVGIKTFPRQTYGVSMQSPEQFLQEHTLIGDYGYIYKYQDAKQFQYPSQNNYFDIHRCLEKGNPHQLPQRLMRNSLAFHRKKGRLTQFLDKNGWMSTVMPMIGSEEARNLSNRDRKNKINSLKPRIKYENTVEKKPKVDQEYHNTISVLMSEKLRIRKKRQELMKDQAPVTPRPIVQPQLNPLHLQNVEQKIAKNTKDFYSTSSTFYSAREQSFRQRQISSKKSNIRVLRQSQLVSSPNQLKRENSPEPSYRSISPSKVSRTIQLKKMKEDDIVPQQDLKLQDWYRKSCYNKWSYKPKRMDSQQEMEQNLQISVAL